MTPLFWREKMDKYPEFMRQECNRISSKDKFTPGIEGFVYDGIDGTQITIWTSINGGEASEHTHEYDEYFIVVQGQYTVIIDGKYIPINVGEEYFIPKGIAHAGRSIPDTRTINAFGGKRAKREIEG
jgi:quercetin dioxygenase-like cupin family protein